MTSAGMNPIRVTEIFWYSCPHCFELEPVLARWQRSKAVDVRFDRVPIQWRPPHRSDARLFYALRYLKREDLDSAVFKSIHVLHQPLSASDETQTARLQTAFAEQNGIRRADIEAALRSPIVSQAMTRADELVRCYPIDGVPSMIVGDRYCTDAVLAGGRAELFGLVNFLVDRIKAESSKS